MKAMKLSDFIMLDSEDKKAIVLHEGVLVGKRDVMNCKVFLFQMDHYYVETYCNMATKSVEEYRVFKSTAHLFPYLNQIPIDDIVN
jgi:hypothetical protein